MVITAECGLYMAQENLKLALAEPQDSQAYRNYIKSLRRSVRTWRQRCLRHVGKAGR